MKLQNRTFFDVAAGKPHILEHIYQKKHLGAWFYRCGYCHGERALPNIRRLNNVPLPFLLLIIGIHSDIRWHSPAHSFVQYDRYDKELAVYEEIKICHECAGSPANGAVFDIIDLVASQTGYQFTDLLFKRIDQSTLIPRKGHFVTLKGFGPKIFDIFFNLQVDRWTYEKIVRGLNPKILELHRIQWRINNLEAGKSKTEEVNSVEQ